MDKKKKGKNARNKSIYKCEVCNGTDSDRPVVACDKCDKWHHFSCVGLESIGEEDDWVCEKCQPKETSSELSSQSIRTILPKEPQNLTLSSGQLKPRFESTTLPSKNRPKAITKPTRNELDPPQDQTSKPTGSRTSDSISETTMSSRRKNFELQKLEEERAMKELRDQQYLQEKYRILTERYSSDTVTERSCISRSTYTKDWINNQDLPPQTNVELNEVEFNSTQIRQLNKKLEDLQLGSTYSNKSIIIDRCDICFMTGKKIDFAVCCTCNKTAHQACMSTIFINEELYWICHQCKAPSQHQDEKQFHNSSKSLQVTPIKAKIQGSSLQQSNRAYCYICRMTDDENLFVKCCLCVKRCHYTCMDIIQIDREDYWICPECKNTTMEPKYSQHKDQPSEISPSAEKTMRKTMSLKQPKLMPTVREAPDNNTHRCEQCGKVNSKLPIVACDVCDKWYHFQCIQLASINGKLVWIRSKCKGPQKSSTEFEPQQSYTFQQNDIVKPEDILEPPTGARQLLTSTQIASRHVVTKDLPIFAGKPEQWPMFLSRFNNSTKLCGYSDSENLDRLQKCLKGNALEAVRSRLLTAESVPEIMKTLEMLYGRPELVVNSLMKKIRSEPPPKADKLNTLVDFALSVKNVCATLEQANLDYHLSNPALIQELVEKLPTNIKIEWAKHKANIQNVTLSTLGNFLYNLAEVISTVTEPTPDKESRDENKKKDSNQKESIKKDSINKDAGHVYAHQFESKRNLSESSSDTSEEMKVHFVHSNLIVPNLVDPTNISKWNKLHRALAYVGRYVSILKAKIRKEIIPKGPLTRDELVASEILLFCQAQFQDFTQEMVLLMRNRILPPDQQKYVHQSSSLYNCTPYLDEHGIIRLHGRIYSANDVAFATKRPIILPRNNRITRLLVSHYHNLYHHRNHRTVYNEIRQRFFIPSLCVVLNLVRSECQRCKNKRAKAQPPQMADLPPIQVDDIVLLVDGTNVRGQYPMARVLETSIGSNNQVRRARIQRFSNDGSKLKQSILWRPCTSLAKLDVHPKDSLSVDQIDSQTEGSVMNGNTDLSIARVTDNVKEDQV